MIYWTYAFNIVINSALSFFTAIFLITFFVLLFRIKHPRMKAICGALPFFKICLDFCLYHFSDWALLHGVNPTLAQTGTRQLSVMLNPLTGIQLSMQDGKTFSLADIIALSISPLWIQMIVSAAAVGSIVAMALHVVRTFRERRRITWILQGSRPLSLQPLNAPLAAWMKKKHITLATSTEVTSPCIAGRNIFFPASLIDILSQEEVEAVIAHEIAHHNWKDGGLRFVCSFIASLFWWIPSKWWQKRMEEMQEQASDAMVHRFGISPLALAEAVLKTAQKVKEEPSIFVFPFVGRRLWLKKRVQRILCEQTKPAAKWRAVQYGLLICSLLSILFGRLWIF